MRNMLIVGASRGLGRSLAEGVPDPGDRLWLVARTPPGALSRQASWIEADLGDPVASASQIGTALGSEPLHCLIYNAGVWETDILARTSLDDLMHVLTVNLLSALALIKVLEPNLRAGAGNIILVGSTCGLENEGSDIPAYVASKFGVRGLAHALRERFRKAGIRVTCISPGSMATDPAADNSQRIPMADMVALFRCLLSLSPQTCPKEIILPATADDDV